jgi:hypothetical protein
MIVMKKTFLITALAVITAVCFSCKKEKTKVPENFKELWGTEWQWEGQGNEEGTITALVVIEFVNSDSVVFYHYYPSFIEGENSREYRRKEAVVYKGATYIKPHLFVAGAKYFYKNTLDEYEPAMNLFTFSEDGFFTFTNDDKGIWGTGEKMRFNKVNK